MKRHRNAYVTHPHYAVLFTLIETKDDEKGSYLHQTNTVHLYSIKVHKLTVKLLSQFVQTNRRYNTPVSARIGPTPLCRLHATEILKRFGKRGKTLLSGFITNAKRTHRGFIPSHASVEQIEAWLYVVTI